MNAHETYLKYLDTPSSVHEPLVKKYIYKHRAHFNSKNHSYIYTKQYTGEQASRSFCVSQEESLLEHIPQYYSTLPARRRRKLHSRDFRQINALVILNNTQSKCFYPSHYYCRFQELCCRTTLWKNNGRAA